MTPNVTGAADTRAVLTVLTAILSERSQLPAPSWTTHSPIPCTAVWCKLRRTGRTQWS